MLEDLNENRKFPRIAVINQREFIHTIVARQEDITPYVRVSFINYVRWYNTARDELLHWQNLGVDDSLRNAIEIQALFCNIQYKREVMLYDEIIIKINSADIKDKEFTLLFTLIKKDGASLISLGKQKISLINFLTGEVLKLSQFLVQNILKPIELQDKSIIDKY